jgi:hypothetical protein
MNASETKSRRRGRRRRTGREEGERRERKEKGVGKGAQRERREYRRGQREAVRKRVEKRRGEGETVMRVGTGRRAGGMRKAWERGGEKGKEKKGVALEEEKGKKGKGSKKGKEWVKGKGWVEKKEAKEAEVVKVTEAWVSGRLTNNAGLSEYVKRKKEREVLRGEGKGTQSERWYETHRKGREGWLVGVGKQPKRPGVIVFRNPEEQGVARKEAVMCGIPTVGRVTPKREKEREKRRTYGRAIENGKQGRLRRGNRRKRAYGENEKDTAKV